MAESPSVWRSAEATVRSEKRKVGANQACLNLLACRPTKCQLNEVKAKHEAETNEACFSLLTCCSAKCQPNEVKDQLSKQLTIDFGDPFMGSK